MLVPDQSHIDRIREALWTHSGGGASLMIGSGFSRSATKTRPHGEDPPIWRDIAKAIADKLYPQDDSDGEQDELTEPRATEGLLSLAQEYETAFGRSDFHHLLQELVRDDDFMPGDTHTRLLKLPWRDVFTTNWDTLLERTRASVANQAYSVVRNMDEIPLAKRPRIVKLHGSFPSHFPLIFTEEDYRTYPTRFAPFVNTVQQAMMETVLCLIGFSGDDPNFLHWSGWVRDNLGPAAPRIYLAGWLGLSSHRRRMLEERNVVPIDLARHPKAAQWPKHLRHRYSTDWLLHTLERGRPYDVTEWPSPPPQPQSSIPDYLQPVHTVVSDAPKAEPFELTAMDSPERLKELLDIWAHNRAIYPGWLVAPASTRTSLSLQMDESEPRILDAVQDLNPVDQIKAVRELVWRREILLCPMSPKLVSAAERVLELVDCQSLTINGAHDMTIEWTAVREAWQTIALALVTTARHAFARDLFDKRLEALSSFSAYDSNVHHHIHHERCLWAVYSGDYDELVRLLDEWQTKDCDPAWMVRKAAMLVEVDQIDKATELTNQALSTIRSNLDNGRSLTAPSREGWALWLAQALEIGSHGRTTEHPLDISSFSRRWRELAVVKCDARSEERAVAAELEGTSQKKDGRPFDLGVTQGQKYSFSNEEYTRWVAARRAIRLSEVGGLPPSGVGFYRASDILKLAADELAATEPELATRLILRTLDYDKDPLLERVLSRSRVAVLAADTAQVLAESCDRVIEYALPRMHRPGKYKRAVFWIERLRVAMEVLSRLVLRLEPGLVETTFIKALGYYRNDLVAGDPWLTEPVGNLLRRSWEALPEDRRISRLPDLLSAPMVGLDDFTAFDSRYLDPGELVQDELVRHSRTPVNEGHWHDVFSLLTRGLRAGGEARKRASLRLAPLVLAARLTETDSSQVAQALWSEEYAAPDGLPRDTSLFDWAFLLFPEPTPGLAEQRFRDKWLAASQVGQENAPNLHDILQQVGSALAGLKVHRQPLALSQDERSYLIDIVEQWSTTPVPIVPNRVFPIDERGFREATRHAISGLRTVISEIQLPEFIGEKLYKKVQQLIESEFPAFALITGLVQAIPSRFDELVLLMRTGLASENQALAEGAAIGLHHWLTASNGVAAQIPSPPVDLVREIGVVIATRSKGSLGQALRTATWVSDEGTTAQKEALRELVLQGLGYLAEELRYDREHAQDDDLDVPFLRWRSAQLAQSLAKQGGKDAPAVSQWLRIIEEDPLPEVRYVKISALVQRPDGDDQ